MISLKSTFVLLACSIHISHTLIEGYLMRYRKLIIKSDGTVVCHIDYEANS